MAENQNSIVHQISSLAQKILVLSGIVQLITFGILGCLLSYKDASDRALFLTKSNGEAIGLMLATGDTFQLKSIISSLETNDIPSVYVIDENGYDVLQQPNDFEEKFKFLENKIECESLNCFLRMTIPLSYNGIPRGNIVLISKIKIMNWAIICLFMLLLTLIFSYAQNKTFRKFSIRLASGIVGLGNLFVLAKSTHEIEVHASNRKVTSFQEVEIIALQIVELLISIIKSLEIERKNEKYEAIAKIASHVAHDLRHPLSVFEAVSRANDWDSFVQVKPELENSLARIENMIDGLRNSDVTRLVRLSPNRLTLGELVAEILPFAREKNAIVRCEGKLSEIHCMMDQPKLVRALLNLLFNAIEAGANEVVIRCNIDESECLLEVVDNGPGVPDHFVANLFVSGATFGKIGGTGLGLSSVKSTILSHRGSISYRRINGSTIFSIKLPLNLSANFDTLEESIEEESYQSLSQQSKQYLPRVYIRLKSKILEMKVLAGLSKDKVELLVEIKDVRSSDVIYTDDEELVLASIEKYHSTTLHHSNLSDAEEITKYISIKYHLKVATIRSKNGSA